MNVTPAIHAAQPESLLRRGTEARLGEAPRFERSRVTLLDGVGRIHHPMPGRIVFGWAVRKGERKSLGCGNERLLITIEKQVQVAKASRCFQALPDVRQRFRRVSQIRQMVASIPVSDILLCFLFSYGAKRKSVSSPSPAKFRCRVRGNPCGHGRSRRWES